MASEQIPPTTDQTAQDVQHREGDQVAGDAVADRKPTFKDVWRQKRNLAWCEFKKCLILISTSF